MNDLSHRLPICVPCQQNLRCRRNGVLVRLGENEIIEADLYECPGCHHYVVTGFARQSVGRFEDPAAFQVKDERLRTLDANQGVVRIGQPEMGEVFARVGDAPV